MSHGNEVNFGLAMSAPATRSPAQPAVVLGLTFLLVGLTFALPLKLVPSSELREMSQVWSPEVGNVYACAAWAGWAHFIYAFRGQSKALAGIKDDFKTGRLVLYGICLAVTLAVLLGIRSIAGQVLFSGLVWVYFIDHFVKAERTFEGLKSTPNRWLTSVQPLVSFGWLSVVLLDVGQVDSYPWVVWIVSLVLATLVLGAGGWKRLTLGDPRGPLLSLFFVGEALVWGTVSSSGGPSALAGVYVFHIAAGSYFHYLGSYFFAGSKTPAASKNRTYLGIVGVNLAVIGLGYLVTRYDAWSWLRPILGVQWFTLWVAVHLVLSDLFPWLKAWHRSSVPQTEKA